MLQHIRRHMLSLWPYRAARLILGVIFIWSGAAKLMDVEGFARIVSVYELVPESMLVPVAFGLPAMELVCGIGLVVDIRYCLTAITGMLLLFIGVLWFGILKGLNVDCGCFSSGELAEQHSLKMAFYRDIVFLMISFYLYLWRILTTVGTGEKLRYRNVL